MNDPVMKRVGSLLAEPMLDEWVASSTPRTIALAKLKEIVAEYPTLCTRVAILEAAAEQARAEQARVMGDVRQWLAIIRHNVHIFDVERSPSRISEAVAEIEQLLMRAEEYEHFLSLQANRIEPHQTPPQPRHAPEGG